MPYGETKVYNDGSHYIAIPHTTRPKRKKSKRIKNENEVKVDEVAEKVLLENKDKSKKEKVQILEQEVNKILNDKKTAKEFVKAHMDKKLRNLIDEENDLLAK